VGLAGVLLIARGGFFGPTRSTAVAAQPTLPPTSTIPLLVPPATLSPVVLTPTQETPTAGPSLTPSPTLPPMATPISAPRSSRFNPTQFTPDTELAQEVVRALGGVTGRIGVAIKDVNTGRGVLISPETEFPAASIFKLEVMYEVYKQRELGALSFDETLVFTQRHVDFDLGTLDRGVGDPIQLAEALERMITISDNSSAVLLTDRVGALNVNRDLSGLGLEHTRLLADDLVTSPYDMLTFMEMLARGEGVSPQASREMLQLMARQRINDRIPRLLPAGTVVAHKTGNLPGVVNDVGLVSSPDTTFAIAVLISDTPTEGLAAQAISEVAATAYRYFSAAQPRPTPTPTSPPSPTPTEGPPPTSVAAPSAPGPTAATAPGGTPVGTATPTSARTATPTPRPS
jgi:beta-lactamase class A